MRVLIVAACAIFLLATDFLASGQAMAADCGKGMLWPYIRNPGDCLTDEEIRTGKLGAFNGVVNTNPDVSAIKPGSPAQGGAVTGTTAATGGGAPNVSAGVSAGAGTFSCNKGYLWPFVRDAGDCLTETEKKEGRTGVYGGGSGITSTNQPAVSTISTAPPEASGTAACHKGWVWPFVRDTGDCLTETEKKEGRTGTYGGGPGITSTNQPVASTVSTAPPEASGAAACHKGWVWPFVRDTGDCLTETEKKEGRTGVYGGGSGVMPVSQTTTSSNSSAPTSGMPSDKPASGAAPACHKGLFWPFVRDAGDCPTDADKNANSGKAQ